MFTKLHDGSIPTGRRHIRQLFRARHNGPLRSDAVGPASRPDKGANVVAR